MLLPVRIEEDHYLVAADEKLVAILVAGAPVDYQKLLLAINSYDEMLDALKYIIKSVSINLPFNGDVIARRAIAKAEGRSTQT